MDQIHHVPELLMADLIRFPIDHQEPRGRPILKGRLGNESFGEIELEVA